MDTLENVERGHIVLSFDLTRARSGRSRLPPSRGELLALIVRTIMGRLDKFPGGKRSGILRTSGGSDVMPRHALSSRIRQLKPIERFQENTLMARTLGITIKERK